MSRGTSQTFCLTLKAPLTSLLRHDHDSRPTETSGVNFFNVTVLPPMGLQIYAMDDPTKVTLPYPAQTRQATATINDIPTNITSISFADKIMITITQHGRLGQWLTVPLLADNPTSSDPHFNLAQTANEDSLLPVSRFQPRTLLGAGGNDRETMGQLYASQIASLITTKNPEESRSLVLGLGLAKVDLSRDTFLEVLDLVTKVL